MHPQEFLRSGAHLGFLYERSISPPYPPGWVIRYYDVDSLTEVGVVYHGENAKSGDTRQLHGGKWIPEIVKVEMERAYRARNAVASRPKLSGRPKLSKPEPTSSRPKLAARPKLLGR